MKTLRFFLLVGVLFNALHAAAPATRQVNVRFTVTANADMGSITYLPADGKAVQPLTFYATDRSPAYSYKGEAALKFFEEGGSEKNTVPVAVCNIPEGMKKALLLFFPRQQSSTDGIRYDVVAVDDSEEAIPAGKFSIINISGREYVGQFGGGAPILIGQGVGPAYEATGRTTLKLARNDESGWAVAGRHVFTITPQARVRVLLYPPSSPTDLYPVVRRITENVTMPVGGGSLVARYP
jgi:hypothetical protein